MNPTKKTIQYYVKHVYGNTLEYVVNAGDAKVLAQLTGRKTITGVERQLVSDLSGGLVTFEQVLPPSPEQWRRDEKRKKNMKTETIQIEANKNLGDSVTNNDILRAAGVKKIHSGWYTVMYNGVSLDCSTVVSSKRNKKGEIK
jgi:hypothetical protein